MSTFSNQAEYHTYLQELGPLPRGFRGATSALSFMPSERPSQEPYKMDVSAIVLDNPTDSFAGVFTRNAVPGAPVLIGRAMLDHPTTQGVLINNRISNVAAKGGVDTAARLCARAAELFGATQESLFPSSTGIIGWTLPEADMMAALPDLASKLDSREETPLQLARAIMTTDSFPKIRVKNLAGGRIMAIAKGAGMIEPNMATMLSFIMTDLDIPRDFLRTLLRETVETSFNAISVDSDQSTSDMVLAFSSKQFPVELDDFAESFRELCNELSLDIVRNGEGTGHVMEISVCGHDDRTFLRALGKAVGNSPLVKTAVYGNDPNVGRILSAVGDCAGNLGVDIRKEKLNIRIGEQTVFHDGVFDIDKEKELILSDYLSENSQNARIHGYPQNDHLVRIAIDLGEGSGCQRIYASDLGHEYVSENADYRS